MKSEIINATRYPLRRVEVLLGVSYAADIGIARTKISEAIKSLSVIRKEPEPAVQFKSFGDNAIQLGVEFWVEKDRVTEAYNLAAAAIKTSLEQAAIQMPSPQRELYFSGDQKLKVQVFNA
jgi:small-conductance mechanosensitive channel